MGSGEIDRSRSYKIALPKNAGEQKEELLIGTALSQRASSLARFIFEVSLENNLSDAAVTS